MIDDLANRLRQVREELRLNQTAMAEQVGASMRAWQGYERGEQVPGSHVIAALCKLGFDANWLLTGQGNMRLNAKDTKPAAPVMTGDFDPELFTDCFMAVEELLEEYKKKISREGRIKLILAVYRLQLDERAEGRAGVSGAQIIRLVRNAA